MNNYINTTMIKLNRKKTRKLLFQKIYAMSFWDFNNELFAESFYDGVFNLDMDIVYFNEMSDIIIRNESFCSPHRIRCSR